MSNTKTESQHNTEPLPDGSDENDRHREFDIWVKTVRDPATASAERVRRLVSRDGHAMAQYQIADLGNERWAIHWQMETRNAGQASPWCVFPKRIDCVTEFFQKAHHFFSVQKASSSEKRSVKQMSELLHQSNSLFGLLEPPEVDGPF